MKRAGNFYVPDDEEIQLKALEEGGWQLDHLAVALDYVTDFSVAVDGGAHVGTWTATMMKRFDQVIAFEPDKRNFQCLQANTVGCANVTRRQEALGAIFERMSMADDERYIGQGNTGGRHLVPGKSVPVIPLDSLKLTKLGFLKLDIEGYEIFALRGAEETIRRCKPVVMIEDKPRMAKRYDLPEGIAQDYLKTFGMSLRERAGSDYIWGW